MASDISPKAEVSPKAKIGDNCKIYPFVYIEDDVVIGDNCVIYPFVSILNGTRMGNGNKIHQGSVIGALPQDFNFCGEETELIIGDKNLIAGFFPVTKQSNTIILANDHVRDFVIGYLSNSKFSMRILKERIIGFERILRRNRCRNRCTTNI